MMLDLRMRRVRILCVLNDLCDRKKQDTGRVTERFEFQLVDSIHQNIGGSHGRAQQAARPAVRPDLERSSRIAHQNAIELFETVTGRPFLPETSEDPLGRIHDALAPYRA